MNPIFEKAVLLLLIIATGYLLKRFRILQKGDATVLSRIIVNLTIPAALISGFRDFALDVKFLFLIPFAFLCNIALFLLGLALTRGQPRETRALYALQLPSYNIGAFVLPFVQSFLPAEGLVGTALFDVGNCPMNCGVLYAGVQATTSKERISCGFVFGELLKSRPFMTYAIMLLLSVLRVPLPETLFNMASGIGAANTILAMLMIGLLLEPQIPNVCRGQVLKILGLRYGCNILISAVVWMLPLPVLVRQVAILSVLAPIPSMSLIYSKKCGCDDVTCGLLSSLSLVISLPLVFLLLLVWKL